MNQLQYVRIQHQGQTLKGVYNLENNQFLQIISGRNSFRCKLMQYTTKPNLEVIRNLTTEEETSTGHVLMQYGMFYNLKAEQASLATKIQSTGDILAEKVRELQSHLVRPIATVSSEMVEMNMADFKPKLDDNGISEFLYLLSNDVLSLKSGIIVLKKTQKGFDVGVTNSIADLLNSNKEFKTSSQWVEKLISYQLPSDKTKDTFKEPKKETNPDIDNSSAFKGQELPEWHIDRIKGALNNIGQVNLSKLLELRIVKEDEKGILTHRFPAGFVTEIDFIQSLNEIQIPALDFTLLQGVMSFFNRFK